MTVAALDFCLLASLPELDGSEKTPLCPPQVDNVSYYFANPYNCSTYYICSNGKPYEQVCPTGLEFNVNERVCDYPASANCVEVPHQFLFPVVCSGGTITANPFDCSSFLYCSGDDYADVISCPTPLLFHAEINVCDWPESVTCAA